MQIKNIAIRTLYKPISIDFDPNTRAEILVSLYKVWLQNKLKGFVFSAISLEGEVISLLDSFCKSFYFLSLNQKILKGTFWEVSFLILSFQLLRIMTQFFFRSCVGSETWLIKFTDVSTCGKFICNIFGCDTGKIGITWAKVQFSVGI